MSRNHNKFKFYSTARLEEILNSDPYFVDDNGKDFTNYIDEIREAYWDRQNRAVEALEKQAQRER